MSYFDIFYGDIYCNGQNNLIIWFNNLTEKACTYSSYMEV